MFFIINGIIETFNLIIQQCILSFDGCHRSLIILVLLQLAQINFCRYRVTLNMHQQRGCRPNLTYGMRQGYTCCTLSALPVLTHTICDLLIYKFLYHLLNFPSLKMSLKSDLKFQQSVFVSFYPHSNGIKKMAILLFIKYPSCRTSKPCSRLQSCLTMRSGFQSKPFSKQKY